MLKNVVRSHELIRQLFLRDYVAVHRKSFLGVAWIAITPVLGIISWLFMNAAGVLRPGTTDVPYPVYVLLSTTLWGLFVGYYRSATATLTAGQSFILQVKYPHEALLVKQALEQAANFGVALLLNLVILFCYGVRPSWMIVLLPVTTLPLFFLGAGLGLIIAVIGVVMAEIKRVCDLCMGFLIFLTPVIYVASATSPASQQLFKWNPLTHLIDAARSTILYGRIPDPVAFAWSALLSFIVFACAWRLFFVSEGRVIEKML